MLSFIPKTKLPPTILFPVISIILILLGSTFYYETKVNQLERGNEVIDVFDGDTLKLKNGQRVRLKTANAPELNLCGGEEAKELLEKLALNKVVRLEEAILDHWGRWTGLVYVEDILIDELMIKKGWAKYNYTKSTRLDDLKTASKYAQDNSLGVYSPQCRQTTNPENPKCDIKGNIDPKKSAYVYHLVTCPGYDQTIVELDLGEQWFCSEEEAIKAGFVKASACK